MEKLRSHLLRLSALGFVLAAGLNGCGWGGTLPDFTMVATPGNVNLLPGSGPIELKVQVQPNTSYNTAHQGLQVTATFPSSALSCVEQGCTQTLAPGVYETTFHFNVLSAATDGAQNIIFTGSDAFGSHSTTATLNVVTIDFQGVFTPGHATILPGDPVPGWDFTYGNLVNPVTITAVPPPGFICLQPGCSATVGNGTSVRAITMNTDPSIAPGVYPIPFTFKTVGTYGPETVTVYSTITVVTQAPDFTMTVSPAVSSLTAGFPTQQFSFTAQPINSFYLPITVTVATPAGFRCYQNPCSSTLIDGTGYSDQNALQFGTDPTLTPGPYILTFTGTSASQTHTATVTINIH